MKFLALTLLALAGLPAPSTASQEKITLAQVLARAGAYVDEFQRQLSSIVAEETYLQEVAPAAGSTVGQHRRALRSDLLLLRPERSLTWVQYRDVFEVDGSPVLERGERITSQSFNATALTAERVNRIRSESARYNIGDIERTLNVPVLPLVILSRRVQPQFRFKVDAAGGTPPRGVETRVPDTPHFRISADVWIVRFEERTRPTLVRTPRGASIPSRGRFWIEPQTGRVLMSEMITENDDVRAQVNVSYQSEPGQLRHVPAAAGRRPRNTHTLPLRDVDVEIGSRLSRHVRSSPLNLRFNLRGGGRTISLGLCDGLPAPRAWSRTARGGHVCHRPESATRARPAPQWSQPHG